MISLQAVIADCFAEHFRNKPEAALAVMKHMSSCIRCLTHDYIDACKTISEMNDEAAGKNRSTSLIKRIEKYINDYANKQVAAFSGNLEAAKISGPDRSQTLCHE